jgi:hypothetical protein
MIRADLLRLAEEGLTAYPPSALGELADSCKSFCADRADVRYCLLADAFRMVADWFDERDRYGGITRSSVMELDGVFSRLPPILDEEEMTAAAAFAGALRDEVSLIFEQGEDRLNRMYRDNPS